MAITKIEEVIDYLNRILREPMSRKELVSKFSSKLWRESDPPLSRDVAEVLGDLTVDFAYYVDDEKIRWEDASFYGPEKLKKLIQEAFNKLEALGIKIPKIEGGQL